MNIMLAGMLGSWEIVLILAVTLLLFGAKKLPALAKGLGASINELRKAAREIDDTHCGSRADIERNETMGMQSESKPDASESR